MSSLWVRLIDLLSRNSEPLLVEAKKDIRKASTRQEAESIVGEVSSILWRQRNIIASENRNHPDRARHIADLDESSRKLVEKLIVIVETLWP
jgi:hypothetical protein